VVAPAQHKSATAPAQPAHKSPSHQAIKPPEHAKPKSTVKPKPEHKGKTSSKGKVVDEDKQFEDLAHDKDHY
jgi:hypothetical protein